MKERVDTGELQGFAAVVWNARDRGFVHYLVLPPDPEVGPLRMVGDLELLKSDLLLLADGVDPSQPPEGFDDPDLDWVD
ncbi:hypothetical protein [Faunimonas pinastri]|uniref:hypothetical protein n=1 Tax=Faunimonas pinastri TaxID=1855383 RepID=UPI00115FAB9A|nr:hypothetical protein [Faunimonas pinastri]